MNTKHEPCSICEKYMGGVACDEHECPVATMKAELERLKAGEYRYIGRIVQNTREEAIEEFAGRIEARLANNSNIRMAEYQFVVADINAVAEEMKEEQKNDGKTD